MPEPTAPYRFVPLADVVVPAPVQPRAVLDDPKLAEKLKDAQELRHDKPLPNGVSGWIDVTWEATTPLLIGDPQDEENGRPGPVFPLVLVAQAKAGTTFEQRKKVLREACIPGSSLRGMIRSVFEIVTFSRLSQLNADFRYGFRNFDDPDYKNQLLASDAVKAGWLEADDDDVWWLRPCTWRRVEISAIQTLVPAAGNEPWITLPLQRKYEILGIYNRSRTPPFVWTDNWAFDPDNETLERLPAGASVPAGSVSATLVVSGPATSAEANKRYEYVFFDPEDEPERIDPAIRRDFERVHGKPNARGGFDPDGSWAVLKPNLARTIPRPQRRIPVFYVGGHRAENQLARGSRLRLGLTRLFKLGHRFAIGELLPPAHRSSRPLDMTDALFGFVHEGTEGDATEALRSRLALGFATLDQPSRAVLVVSGEQEAVLMTPRASFEPYYLVGARLSYSAELPDGQPVARLAGRKRYPVRTKADAQGMTEHAAKAPTKRVVSRLRFIAARQGEALRFVSRIRFHNLHRLELGALLWALTFGGSADHRHAVGRAKPFGYGALEVDPAKLQLRYTAGNAQAPARWQDLLTEFETFMAPHLGRKLRECEPIRVLLGLANLLKGSLAAKSGALAYLDSPKAHMLLRKQRFNEERSRTAPSRLLTWSGD